MFKLYSFLLLVLHLWSTRQTTKTHHCPGEDWAKAGWSLCFLSVDIPMKWLEAENYCRKFNAHLLFVERKVFGGSDPMPPQSLYRILGSLAGQWVSIHLVNEKLWWEGDNPLPARTYSKTYEWAEGQPDISQGSCGFISYHSEESDGDNITLKMAPCDQSRTFTCFRRGIHAKLTEDHQRCEQDWVTNPDLDVCLREYKDSIDPIIAQSQCQNMQSDLWEPSDAIKMHFIKFLSQSINEDSFRSVTYTDEERDMLHESQFCRMAQVVNLASDDHPTETLSRLCCYFSNCTVIGEPLQLNYICQKLELKRTTNKVKLEVKLIQGHTSSVLDEKGIETLNSSVASSIWLSCYVNSSGYLKPIYSSWVKDGVYVHERLTMEIQLVPDFHAPTSLGDPSSQGRYRCEVWTLKSDRKSSEIQIIFRDIMTVWLYLDIEIDVNKDFSIFYFSKVDKLILENILGLPHHSQNFCMHLKSIVKYKGITGNSSLLTLKIGIYNNMTKELSSRHYDPPFSPENKKLKLSLVKKYFKKAHKYARLFFTKGPHAMIPNNCISTEKNHKDIDLYSDSLIEKCSMANITSLHVDKFYLRSTRGCQPIKLYKDGKTIRFGYGLKDEVSDSITVCPMTGLPPLAEGRCEGDFTDGYRWKFVQFHACSSNLTYSVFNTSTLTDDLMNAVGDDIAHALRKVENVTSNHLEEMSYHDLVLVSEFVKTATNKSEHLDQEVSDTEMSPCYVKPTILVVLKLSSTTGKSLIDILSNTMNVPLETTTYENDRSGEIQARLLDSLETVVSRVQLKEFSVTWSTSNFLVSIIDSNNSANGLGLVVPLNDNKNTETYLYGDYLKFNEAVDVAVFLPQEAYDKLQQTDSTGLPDEKIARTSFIIYKTKSLFDFLEWQNDQNSTTNIVSFVVKVSINGTESKNLREKVRLKFRIGKNSTQFPVCVYAKIDPYSSSSHWSTKGLLVSGYDEENYMVECVSDHLTNFAVLAGFSLERDTTMAQVLSFISMIGMTMSIVSLLFVILCQMCFKKFRRGQYQLALLNLAISLIIINLLILLGVDRTSNEVGCMVVAALLHYFLLVSFSWMLIEAILQYYKFVKVFDTHVSKFVIKTLLPAWILPALVVAVTAIIDYNQFRSSHNYCWIAREAFYYAFLLPLGLIIITNIFMFVKIIKGISCDRPKNMYTNQTKAHLVWLQVQTGMCCFIVMGLTWCFALFAFGEAALVMQILFAVFNSLQGVFIFILFNLREKVVRKAWHDFFYRLCKRGKKRLEFSDSYPFASASPSDEFKKKSDISSSPVFVCTQNFAATSAQLEQLCSRKNVFF